VIDYALDNRLFVLADGCDLLATSAIPKRRLGDW
jgi:hypothetical protein